MDSTTPKIKTSLILWTLSAAALFILSLITGRYPLSVHGLLQGDRLQTQVFLTLRLSRTLTALIGGFSLGVSGFVFQCVFRNSLASPDIIGISSGAGTGAAFGILFAGGALSVIFFSFAGALLALLLVIALSSFDKSRKSSTFVITGIIIHSVAQAALMCMKVLADPEKELASIEYWIMGSLNGITGDRIAPNLILCVISVLFLFFLYRQTMLLTLGEEEAKMLGVNVFRTRFLILLAASFAASSVVSLTGLISFISLLPAHIARQIAKDSSRSAMFLSGAAGSCILLLADIAARSIASSELPLSIFTSFIGAPVLLIYLFHGRQDE